MQAIRRQHRRPRFHRRQRFLFLGHRQFQADAGIAHIQHIAGAHCLRSDPLAIDERAAAALQIRDQHLIAKRAEPAMRTRYPRIIELQIRLRLRPSTSGSSPCSGSTLPASGPETITSRAFMENGDASPRRRVFLFRPQMSGWQWATKEERECHSRHMASVEA